MSNSHGDANDTETTVNNTHVTGSNSVSIVSGGDTNIIGSNVNGGAVSAVAISILKASRIRLRAPRIRVVLVSVSLAASAVQV